MIRPAVLTNAPLIVTFNLVWRPRQRASKQNLLCLSCSSPKASCDGFNVNGAYDWVNRENGRSICTEASYPYVSGSGVAPSCKRYEDPNFKCERPNLGSYFYGGGHFGDHTLLEAAVMKQPVAATLMAGSELFKQYKGGVLIRSDKCNAKDTDRAVLIVGFDTRDGVPYWKLQDQWDTNWRDNGYQGQQYGACGKHRPHWRRRRQRLVLDGGQLLRHLSLNHSLLHVRLD